MRASRARYTRDTVKNPRATTKSKATAHSCTILRARIGAALRRHSLRALENEYLGKIENEKRHSENLLRNILPAEIATRLRNGESNIADHFDDATVIFADVVGFGKITARMKAFEIVACLNQLFSEFDKLAEDAGIEKIKTIRNN
jgi:adenylate cyclase